MKGGLRLWSRISILFISINTQVIYIIYWFSYELKFTCDVFRNNSVEIRMAWKCLDISKQWMNKWLNECEEKISETYMYILNVPNSKRLLRKYLGQGENLTFSFSIFFFIISRCVTGYMISAKCYLKELIKAFLLSGEGRIR